ncbi:hypothetical protein SMSKK35_3563 [Stenotrophomonas maltophilia SKK35]|nr:hypothetical protein SMSKK35_3563 [Stenotrophomonas maltophilia SKK35]
MTELTVTSVSPACGRFTSASATAICNPVQSGSLPPRTAMKMPFVLTALTLAAASLLAPTAQAADTAPAQCVPLTGEQQIVRAGADKNVLLRTGDDHYVVHFRNSCTSAVRASHLGFKTDGKEATELCGEGRSQLDTGRGTCDVARIEPIDAERFKREARLRSR